MYQLSTVIALLTMDLMRLAPAILQAPAFNYAQSHHHYIITKHLHNHRATVTGDSNRANTTHHRLTTSRHQQRVRQLKYVELSTNDRYLYCFFMSINSLIDWLISFVNDTIPYTIYKQLCTVPACPYSSPSCATLRPVPRPRFKFAAI